MTPAVIGAIASRYIPGGGTGGPGGDWDFQGVSYTPPVSEGTTHFDFAGDSYTPPVTD